MGDKVQLTVKTRLTKRNNPVPRTQRAALRNPLNSPADQVLNLQRTMGNQAVQRLLNAGVIQAKLKIGQPNHVYEQEADRVAEQVMSMPESQVQRQGMEKEEEPLQTKSVSNHSPKGSSSLEVRINSVRNHGQPLSESVRSFFEPRFGYDFSSVRLHTDNRATEATRTVNAKAFTIGRDIVFGAGQYAPQTPEGKQLLAHELTHILQQRARGTMIMRYESGQAVINHHTSETTGCGCAGSGLDEEALGLELAGLALDPARHPVVEEAFNLLAEGVQDNVAGHMVSELTDDQIRTIGMTDSGRILLHKVQDYLQGGWWVTSEEESQVERIDNLMEGITWQNVEQVEPRTSLPAKTLHLNFVKYYGCELNTDNFGQRTASIYSQQCNITVIYNVITVSEDDTRNDLRMFFGTEDILDIDVGGESYEGDAVRDRANASGSNQVPVAFVPDFRAHPLSGMEGFCPMSGYLVVVANRAQPEFIDTLAHEIGHFYGLGHDNGNSRNLMAEGNVRVRDSGERLLSPWECSRLRSKL